MPNFFSRLFGSKSANKNVADRKAHVAELEKIHSDKASAIKADNKAREAGDKVLIKKAAKETERYLDHLNDAGIKAANDIMLKEALKLRDTAMANIKVIHSKVKKSKIKADQKAPHHALAINKKQLEIINSWIKAIETSRTAKKSLAAYLAALDDSHIKFLGEFARVDIGLPPLVLKKLIDQRIKVTDQFHKQHKVLVDKFGVLIAMKGMLGDTNTNGKGKILSDTTKLDVFADFVRKQTPMLNKRRDGAGKSFFTKLDKFLKSIKLNHSQIGVTGASFSKSMQSLLSKRIKAQIASDAKEARVNKERKISR